MEGFLLEERIPEARLIPLIEAAVRVHKAHTPLGRRVKHLVKDIGEKKFRHLLDEHLQQTTELDLADGFEKRLTPLSHGGPGVRVEAAVFAGEITTSVFRRLAKIARDHADGYMATTADQNVAFLLSDPGRKEKAVKALAEAGFAGDTPEEQTVFRICPGNHECRMGLCPTRDVAREVLAALGSEGRTRSWAISGCSNSCAQPQLSDFGILAVKSLKGEAQQI
jgi:sulfite reductase beta subunit-like hemoprotein